VGCNYLAELPAVFGSLASLERLWAEDNRFLEFPRPILKLSSLRTLRLSNNALSRVPRAIAGLAHLEDLVRLLPDSSGRLLRATGGSRSLPRGAHFLACLRGVRCGLPHTSRIQSIC
jgi:Leucine-rich repeat (LRR) protein